MSEAQDQVDYLLAEKYPGKWRKDIGDILWIVDDIGASVVIACPGGEYLALGAFIGSSSDYWSVCNLAGQANRNFESGRIFVAEAQPGTYCLIVKEIVSEYALASDHSLMLIWRALAQLLNSTRDAREAASHIEGFDLLDPADSSFGMVTFGWI